MVKNYALILAAGSGNRMKEDIPKAFLNLGDQFLLEYSIQAFTKHPQIDEIILVVPQSYLEISQRLIYQEKYSKVKQTILCQRI